MSESEYLKLIQEDKHTQFNSLVEKRDGRVDLSEAMFRGYDLRKFHLKSADLSNCYLRNADLRGMDLSNATMAGASLRDAKVSGTLFPPNLRADELILSLEHGTRLRETQ